MTSFIRRVAAHSRRHAVVVLTVCMLSAAVVELAACGGSDSTNGSGNTGTDAAGGETSQPTAAAASIEAHRKPIAKFVPPGPAVDASSLAGKEIWFVPISTSIPIIPPQQEGIEQAVKALGMTVHVCDGSFVPATEASCLKQAVNAGAAGIITDAIDPATVSTAAEYAAAHQVPIATISEVGTETETLQFLPSADVANAPIAADWIAADSGGKAKVIAAEVSGDKGTTAAAEAFADQLGKECPECELDTITQSPADASKYTSSISTALLQHPETEYVFAQFDALVAPVARGIQQSGHQVKLVSTTAALSNVEQVADGTQAAEVAVNPNYYGWLAVDRMVRMLLDKPAPKSDWLPVRVFDSTNVGSLELTAGAASSGVWWGPLTYQAEFAKLWGV